MGAGGCGWEGVGDGAAVFIRAGAGIDTGCNGAGSGGETSAVLSASSLARAWAAASFSAFSLARAWAAASFSAFCCFRIRSTIGRLS